MLLSLILAGFFAISNPSFGCTPPVNKPACTSQISKPAIESNNVSEKSVSINKPINYNEVVHSHYTPVYNVTYITPSGSTFRSSFWDNYWIYRVVTNHNNIVANGKIVNYGFSGIWKDILTMFIIIVIVVAILFICLEIAICSKRWYNIKRN